MRLYFGGVPKSIEDSVLQQFFAKYGAIDNFISNSKFDDSKFGFFDIESTERILKQNGLKTLGFMLKLRPAKRENYTYTEKPKEFGEEDLKTMKRIADKSKQESVHDEAVNKWRSIFTTHEKIGDFTDASESDSIAFDSIPRRLTPKEFAQGQKGKKKAIIPVRK